MRLYVSLRQLNIGIYSGFRMLSESSFIESSIFDLESGFSIVESGFLKCESEHESGFFPSPGFLRVRVQVRVRVRSGFRSMPITTNISVGTSGATLKMLWIEKTQYYHLLAWRIVWPISPNLLPKLILINCLKSPAGFLSYLILQLNSTLTPRPINKLRTLYGKWNRRALLVHSINFP